MTKPFYFYKILWCLGFCLWVSSCTPSLKFQEDISTYEKDIARLEAKLKDNPDDIDAMRDLGAIYFQTARYEEARHYLQQAFRVDQQDPKLLLYMGLSAEFDNHEEIALKIYGKYAQVSRLSPYRKLLQGRYQWLVRQSARQEARKVLKDSLNTAKIIPNAVAVFPFTYQGADDHYAPLGKGLGEMLIIDLKKVKQLRLLERIRIQAILDELKLAARSPGGKSYVDSLTAPRTGMLLGAAHIVSGVYDILPKQTLYLTTSYWDARAMIHPEVTNNESLLKNLFQVEKAVVFSLLDKMGIELTHEEREGIQHIPTENLQAFLAYCMGLELEDEGRLDDALGMYRQAVSIDPDFGLSKSKIETLESMSAGVASWKELLAMVKKSDPLFSRKADVSRPNLVKRRLNSLTNNLGSGFYPGDDQRKPLEEGLRKGASSVILPPPPPPPPTGGD